MPTYYYGTFQSKSTFDEDNRDWNSNYASIASVASWNGGSFASDISLSDSLGTIDDDNSPAQTLSSDISLNDSILSFPMDDDETPSPYSLSDDEYANVITPNSDSANNNNFHFQSVEGNFCRLNHLENFQQSKIYSSVNSVDIGDDDIGVQRPHQYVAIAHRQHNYMATTPNDVVIEVPDDFSLPNYISDEEAARILRQMALSNRSATKANWRCGNPHGRF